MLDRSAVFIEKAIGVHGEKYDYSKINYTNSQTKISIFCRSCRQSFNQLANSHIQGRGCPTCGVNRSRRTGQKLIRTEEYNREVTKEFIKKAKIIHGDMYDYSVSLVLGSKEKVTIRCKACKQNFEQSVGNHLRGKGCRNCSYEDRGILKRLTTEQVVSKFMEVHGNAYDYSKVYYIKQSVKVTVTCNSCKSDFLISAPNHFKGYGCPVCSKSRRYSKKGIQWLTYLSKVLRIKIQHAENGGELRIPLEGSRFFKADGYSKRTNTIYEFYGDRFHGNPKVFSPDSKPNFYSDLTCKQLFDKTKAREKILKKMGYNVVSIWESDWRVMKRSLLS